MILLDLILSRFPKLDLWVKSVLIILYYATWSAISQYFNLSYAIEAIILIDVMSYLWGNDDDLIIPSLATLALIVISLIKNDDHLLIGALILFSVAIISIRERMKLSNLIAATVLISVVFLPEGLLINESMYYLVGVCISISLTILVFYKRSKDFFGAELPLLMCLIVGNMLHNKELFLYPFLTIWIMKALSSIDKFDFIQMENGNLKLETIIPISSVATYLALTDGTFFAMALSGGCILIAREIKSIEYAKIFVLLNVFLMIELLLFSKEEFGALSYILLCTITLFLIKAMFHARFTIEKIIREFKANYISLILIFTVALLVQVHLFLKLDSFRWFYSIIFLLIIAGTTLLFGSHEKIPFFRRIEKFEINELPKIEFSTSVQVPRFFLPARKNLLELLSITIIKDRFAFNELVLFGIVFSVMLFLSMAVLLK